MTPPVLELKELTRSFGGTTALAGLGICLEAGDMLGLIGPDAAGKTTAMRIACGLLKPDSGQARVLGHDCVTQAAAIRPLLGYMPQRFSLYPDLSVDENLRFFSELHGIPAALRRVRRERLLAFGRLEPYTRRRAGDLSGGMKQKLALACTLIHEPRLLILDEPTTGVDPVSRQEFWALLSDLSRGGMALWVSTPYMDEAARCDRVQLLHQGRVIAEGAPAEIAATFPRRLINLPGGAAKRLERRFAGIQGVDARRFGNDLRLVCDTEGQERDLRRLAEAEGLVAESCAPGLEDAFFALVERAGSRA